MIWRYQALTRLGQEVSGSFEGDKDGTLSLVKQEGLELIDIRADYWETLRLRYLRPQINAKALGIFFEDFANMFTTGMNVSQILSSLAQTTSHAGLRSMLIKAQQSVKDGDSLSEALSVSRSLPWIVHSTIYAGEQSGRLKEAVVMLGEYFRKQGEIKGKLVHASAYPAMVFMLLMGVMLFISLHVVPRLRDLLPANAMDNPATKIVLCLSALVQKSWFILLIVLGVGIFLLINLFHEKKHELEGFAYRLPLIGGIIKESALAVYFLNLSVLLKSGVPLVKSLEDLELAFSNVVSRKFLGCRDHILGGSSFWEAIEQDGFFPVVISLTLRRGEESTQIPSYCDNLAVYFQQRSQVKMEQAVNLVQPFLLGAGGLFLVVIAFAFLVPIYGSLNKIAGG